MRRQLALLLCLSLAIAAAAEGGTLRMRGGGAAFKIALFADLHFGEDAWTEWGPVQDLNSVGVMCSVLDDERPGSEIVNFLEKFSPNSFYLNWQIIVC